MTDITDQDRRLALRWCDMLGDSTLHEEAAATRRVILATVDAPEPTLAEELRAWAEKHYSGGGKIGKYELLDLADRVEQIERDLAEAREERDAARAEVDRLTAERDEANVAPDQQANHLETSNSSFKDPLKEPAQNPADVKPGEVWRVQVGDAIGTGLCDADPIGRHWAIYLDGGSQVGVYRADQITLLHRLVPAPRVITNPDELDKLPFNATVRAGDTAYERGDESYAGGEDWWYRPGDSEGFTAVELLTRGPVTALWGAGE